MEYVDRHIIICIVILLILWMYAQSQRKYGKEDKRSEGGERGGKNEKDGKDEKDEKSKFTVDGLQERASQPGVGWQTFAQGYYPVTTYLKTDDPTLPQYYPNGTNPMFANNFVRSQPDDSRMNLRIAHQILARQ